VISITFLLILSVYSTRSKELIISTQLNIWRPARRIWELKGLKGPEISIEENKISFSKILKKTGSTTRLSL